MLTCTLDRLWRDPPVVVQTKRAVKADPTAPARSTIRRQPTVRIRDHSTPEYGRSLRFGSLDLLRRDHEVHRRLELLPVSFHNDRVGRDLSQRFPPSDGELDATESVDGLSEISDSVRPDNEQDLRRAYRPAQSSSPRGLTLHLPPTMPGRQETLHAGLIEVAARPQVEQMIPPPPQYIPTPPRLSTDADNGSASPRARLMEPFRGPAPRTSPLTPRFAPAYYTPQNPDGGFNVARARSRHEGARPMRRVNRRSVGIPRANTRQHESLDRATDLIRSGPVRPNRALAHDHGSAAMNPSDGLGDRRRSLSPEDTWETLLTTIAPDERLPSASSSFTSASASISTSASASVIRFNASTQPTTARTTPSAVSQTGNALSNVCDDPTDSEWDDMDTSFNYHLDFPRPVPDTNYLRDIDDLQTLSQRISPSTRTLSEAVEARALRQVIDTLLRHEPVPDELWTSAGFVPSLGGRNNWIDRGRL